MAPSFFSRSVLDPQITASDVRKAYASRIEQFFRQVEGRNLNIFRRREYSLENLLTWANNILETKSELESELSLRNNACTKAEEERDALKISLEDAESNLRKMSAQSKKMENQHTAEIHKLLREHSKNLADAQRKYDLDMARADREHENTKAQHEKYVASLTQQHQSTVEILKNNHKDLVESMRRDYQSNMESLKQDHAKTVNRLKGQLLVNQNDFTGWPDEKLRMKFMLLKQSVDLITAPQRQELTIPKGKDLEPKLDPSGFIARAGNGNAYFLLRSLIWSILYEHFFSLPFGFGIFGPDASQNPLLQVFSSWCTLIEGHNMQGMICLPKSN